MNIKQLSVQELKALAYDNIAMMEQCQKNIKKINEELSMRPPEQTKYDTGNSISDNSAGNATATEANK